MLIEVRRANLYFVGVATSLLVLLVVFEPDSAEPDLLSPEPFFSPAAAGSFSPFFV
jgi:hypothetical protein